MPAFCAKNGSIVQPAFTKSTVIHTVRNFLSLHIVKAGQLDSLKKSAFCLKTSYFMNK